MLSAVLALHLPAWSQSPPGYALSIPRLPLASALLLLSKQAELQLATAPNVDTTMLVGPLQGHYDVDSALMRLLANTGYVFKRSGGGYIVHRPQPAPQSSPIVTTPVLPTAEPNTPRSWPETSRWSSEVIVLGTRIIGSSARELGTVVPARIFSRSELDALGISTLPDLTKYFTQQPFSRAEGTDGSHYANLRGLGIESTAILINGWWPGPTAANSVDAFDLNIIPITAIERIDVLPSGTSELLGASAADGVVNVILRQPKTPELQLYFGTADGGAAERRAAVSAGYAGATAKGSVLLDFFHRDPLLGAERSRWRNQDFRRYGGFDWRSPESSPGNIRSLTGQPLPGLSAARAAVPADSTGTVSVDDFLETAGQTNLHSAFESFSIITETTRASLVASGELDLDGLVVFGELLGVDRRTIAQASPPTLNGVVVPRTNPFNPFGIPVAATVMLSGIAPRQTITEATWSRAVAGARGWYGDWAWELSVLHAAERGSQQLVNEVDPIRAAAALASSDPQSALNVFQDGPAATPALLASLVSEPRVGQYSSTGSQAAAWMEGPLVTWSGGKLHALLGSDWRHTEMSFQDIATGSLARRSGAAHAQLQLKLDNLRVGLKTGGRIERYDDLGSSFSSQHHLSWKPVQAVTMRTSYKTSFRPPSLYELHAPRWISFVPVIDPRRDNEVAIVAIESGGNIALEPAETQSWTAGITLAAGGSSYMRISADYWSVSMKNRILMVPYALLLANEARFAERFARAEPTFADVVADQPGALLAVDVSRMNIGRLQTSGADLSLSSGVDTRLGRFTSHLSATWIERYRTSDLPDGPSTDRVGVANPAGTITRWLTTVTLGWSRDAVALTGTVRYVPRYHDFAINGRTGGDVPAQAILDLQSSIELGDDGNGLTDGLRLSLGINNVMNVEAPFANVGFSAGYDQSHGDLRGRFVYIRVVKQW